MALEQNTQFSLYCEEEEEKWEDFDDQEQHENSEITFYSNNLSLSSLLVLEQDLLWDDEELQQLLFKEKETLSQFKNGDFQYVARREAVEWMMKVNAHYGFSSLTAILAVNYLDRFILTFQFEENKPWMMHLVAVTCLSLAAKVEETDVPLLVDIQVEDAKYVFEAKTIQRMELLVLSALKWRMNPVTPLSFLDHIIRRHGLKSYIHLDYLRRCENLLLSLVPDLRIVCYLPSVLATAIMLHVINQVEPRNVGIDYENQLLGLLKINKEEVNECCELISEISRDCSHGKNSHLKRKLCQLPPSPDGVMDKFLSSDSSNESWEMGSSISSSSSLIQPIFKKRRVREQQMKLPSLNRVFVDAVASPH